MKNYSIFKFICIILCSFSLIAACSSNGNSGNSGNSNNGSASNGSDSGSENGSGSPYPDGTITNYDPYISPTERHIIADGYLLCSGIKYYITESGEVYSDYKSSYNYNRVEVYDKSEVKVTDDIKIVSGECIKGSREAILKSNNGKYYITNISTNSNKELKFYKSKDELYGSSDEVKFGNVEYSGSTSQGYYYASLKEGAIHYWEISNEDSPIKVSGAILFDQMYVNGKLLYAITKDGILYKLNTNTMLMEEITDYYSKKGDYNVNYEADTEKINNIKFKSILGGGSLLSTDNHLYQYRSFDSKERFYRIVAQNNDNSYDNDLIIDKVYEEESLYYVDSYGNIKYYEDRVVKASNGKYYSLLHHYNYAYISQLSDSDLSKLKEVSDDMMLVANLYYYNSSSSNYYSVFYKTAEGLDVLGREYDYSIYGRLGIGRNNSGIISTTNGIREKVKFSVEDGNVNVIKMWQHAYWIFAQTDKGFYSWGSDKGSLNNPAIPVKNKLYKITDYPSDMGSVAGTYNCDDTLTYTEVDNPKVKESVGDIFITEDGRAFRLFRGVLYFQKEGWRKYTCESNGNLVNSFVQLDLGEGVVAKGFIDGERVMTNIGILYIVSFNFFDKWSETVGTIVD